MSDALSFTEIDGQPVELLPARTVLSLFSAGGDGGLGGVGGKGGGGVGLNALDVNALGGGLNGAGDGTGGGGSSANGGNH